MADQFDDRQEALTRSNVSDETNYENRSRQLMEMWSDLKRLWRREVEAKKKLEQQLIFNEENIEWSKTHSNQLKQQLEEYQNCLAIVTEQLKTLTELKEEKHELEKKITEANNAFLAADESHRQEKALLQKCIDGKDVEIKELHLTIKQKEMSLSQAKRDISEAKAKAEENLNELKEDYQQKILELYKEFDSKYDKCLKANDEKIIEIRANCMLSVEKTKEEYEAKVTKLEFQNYELKEKVNQYRLELEAWKCNNGTNTSINTNRSASKKSAQKQKPTKDENRLRTGISLKLIESDEESARNPSIIQKSNEQKSEPPSASKRKRLTHNDDVYLDFLENEDISL